MWICPLCNQKFLNTNHPHSCNERTVEDFLKGKSETTIQLFHYFIDELKKLGDFKLHPAKSQIAFAADIRFGYIKILGSNFIDVALTFNQPYHDNLCFYRIGEVPGSNYYQHYLRIYQKEDINKEGNICTWLFRLDTKSYLNTRINRFMILQHRELSHAMDF